MCYSARVRADYKKFVREFGAVMGIKAFFRLSWERSQGGPDETPDFYPTQRCIRPTRLLSASITRSIQYFARSGLGSP